MTAHSAPESSDRETGSVCCVTAQGDKVWAPSDESTTLSPSAHDFQFHSDLLQNAPAARVSQSGGDLLRALKSSPAAQRNGRHVRVVQGR